MLGFQHLARRLMAGDARVTYVRLKQQLRLAKESVRDE